MDNQTCYSDSDIDFLRSVVQDFLSKHEYKSALFWADKITDLGGDLYSDLLIKLRCIFYLNEYHRCIYIIDKKDLDSSLPFRLLKVKSHFMVKQYKEALETILKFREREGEGDEDEVFEDAMEIKEAKDCKESNRSNRTNDPRNDIVLSRFEENQYKSSLFLMEGHIYYTYSSNTTQASICYRKALKLNPLNHEAFDSLTRNQMLPRNEEEDLLKEVLVPSVTQLSCPLTLAVTSVSHPTSYPLIDISFTKYLYYTLITKYAQYPLPSHPLSSKLSNNLDLLTSTAERLFFSYRDQECYSLTSSMLSQDNLHPNLLLIHLSCLMSLQKRIQVFKLSHRLMSVYPDKWISWHSIACYYLLMSKSESARRYLSKSLSLTSNNAYDWLLFGHSFACESEDDQAMAAYLKACHLSRGCHLSFLYIAMSNESESSQEGDLTANQGAKQESLQESQESQSSGNQRLFLRKAFSLCNNDPFLLNQMAVYDYRKGDYESALVHLTNGLKGLNEGNLLINHTLLNNKGHVHRKRKEYQESLENHRQALNIIPDNYSTMNNIAFILALKRDFNRSIDFFIKSLSIKRDHPFANNMLNKCIEQLINPSIRSLKDKDREIHDREGESSSKIIDLESP